MLSNRVWRMATTLDVLVETVSAVAEGSAGQRCSRRTTLMGRQSWSFQWCGQISAREQHSEVSVLRGLGKLGHATFRQKFCSRLAETLMKYSRWGSSLLILGGWGKMLCATRIPPVNGRNRLGIKLRSCPNNLGFRAWLDSYSLFIPGVWRWGRIVSLNHFIPVTWLEYLRWEFFSICIMQSHKLW